MKMLEFKNKKNINIFGLCVCLSKRLGGLPTRFLRGMVKYQTDQ